MTLADLANQLNLRYRRRARGKGGKTKRLPALVLMTDAARLADPLPAAAALPRGSAVILRHYDHPDRAALARALARLCRRRGLMLLVAGDRRLAEAVGADGLHLSEPLVRRGRAQARRRHGKPWVMTAAAHSPAALWRARRGGADAALLGPIFATASHPGAAPLGVLRFAAWCRASPIAVYALGGIGLTEAPRLGASGAVGIAGIGGLVAAAQRKRGAAEAAPPQVGVRR